MPAGARNANDTSCSQSDPSDEMPGSTGFAANLARAPAGRMGAMPADLLYLRDAFLREIDATVVEVDPDERRIDLDRTVFYPTGGGQPHDTGTLAGHPVVSVRKEGDHVWHVLGGDGPLPAVGEQVHGE